MGLETRRLRRGAVVHVNGVPAEVVHAKVRTHEGNWRLIQNVTLTEAQSRLVEAWARELQSDQLAEDLFVLSHAHDGTRWVPLDAFRAAERRILEQQPKS